MFESCYKSNFFDLKVYEVNINESAPVGTPIVRLKVTDEDSGLNAKVRLNIVGGNKNGQFRMNPTSGVLYVARPLDAESKSSYTPNARSFDNIRLLSTLPNDP